MDGELVICPYCGYEYGIYDLEFGVDGCQRDDLLYRIDPGEMLLENCVECGREFAIFGGWARKYNITKHPEIE